MSAPHPPSSPSLPTLFWSLVAATWLTVAADVWRKLR